MRLTCVMSDEHPARHVLDHAGRPEPGPVLYRADYDPAGQLIRAVVDPAFAPAGAELWFAEIPETDADPPATNLVAFASPEWPDGTVVARAEWERAGVDPREQVGALRWWTRTGQVHQVYVAAHMRRRRVGTKLVLTGAALTVGRRWPSLWSSGDLTDAGHGWVAAAVWSDRVGPRRRVVPPMDPE
jgi:GNAT superfamily N-acetyltransferase